MSGSDVCKLVTSVFAADDIGQRMPTETEREVYCTVESVGASEFFKAGEAGLKAEYKITMFFGDYAGEETLIYNGVRYGVYRTYRRKNDKLELYVERKAGA